MTGRVGLSARGREALSRLRVAQGREALAEAGLPPDLVAALEAHGLIEPQGETASPADYQDIYAGWRSQRGMLIDHARTLAFQSAIEAVVRPGDRVIDVGCGSGVLAMFAARAGASAVWGLELTAAMADWAGRLAAANDLSAVRIVQGDGAGFSADGPVDVVVSEFAGMWLVDEWRHHAAFTRVRDRNLRPGGQVIPRAARLFLSAVDSRKLYRERGYGFWEEPVHGLDFSAVRAAEVAQPRRVIVSADAQSLVGTQAVAAFDYLAGTESDSFFEAEASFDYPAGGGFHGLVGHFELDMAEHLVLGTGPAVRETHWHQSYFPLPAMAVPPGGRVAVRARTFLDPARDLIALGVRVAGPGEALRDEAPEHVFVLE